MGLVESNGHQNYKNWEQMMSYLPSHEKPWVHVKEGLYHTSPEFFNKGGGIYDELPHYESFFK